MLRRHYIGVTGITSPYQTTSLLRSLTRSDYDLMIGILVSSRSLAGRPALRCPDRYPAKVRPIVEGTKSERVLKILHYSGPNDPNLFGADLTYMHNSWGTNSRGIHGYQFNMVWPDADVLARYKETMPEKVMILQVGKDALRMVNDDPKSLIKRLQQYPHGLFDAVLIDKSMGSGEVFNPGFVAPFVKEIAESNLDLSTVVAGGLGPGTMDRLERLVELCDGYRFSIDAEGRLRDNVDRLVIQKARIYMREAQRMLLGPNAL